MIWADDTHEYSCSTCRHSGAPCPAAAQLAERLAAALRLSAPFTAEDFEVTGSGRLTGCARSCAALYVASTRAVRVYCDVDGDADPAPLARFAAAFFGPGAAGALLGRGGPEQIPCAMVQALPRARPGAAAQMAGA
ncbi:hypothetical protein [Actibacterium sp. MT2.3-13A]|uniref:hypothetical protein n=1 Tax=Actibacterium sp. MT2.3-13A TaxID=2828332 RepID=UPI001BAAE3D8|nr:hypothetical protein [Actibacterium sp. MT2.3-13A]